MHLYIHFDRLHAQVINSYEDSYLNPGVLNSGDNVLTLSYMVIGL